MKNKILWSFVLLLLNPLQSFAQAKEKVDSFEQKNYPRSSYIRVGVHYFSDWVYAGRKDPVKAPYLTPSIAYYHKSGLFIKGAFSYLMAAHEKRVDLYSLTGGYAFTSNRFYAGLSGSTLFYNDSSYSVQSEVGGSFYAYAGYDFSIAELALDATTLFSGSTDLVTGAELSRTFYAVQDRLKFSPTVYLMAGTQNYYSEYYQYRSTGMRRRYGRGGNGSDGVPYLSEIKSASKFQLLAYELSLPLSYTFNRLRLSITPVYAIPQNPAIITIDQTTIKEELENTFFWSAGLSYRLK